MATLPGMRGDVYFGDTDSALPDWRKANAPADDDDTVSPADDDDTVSREERAAVVAMLGFEPAEIDDPEPQRNARAGAPDRYDYTWITIGGHAGPGGEQHAGGHAVMIDSRGRIVGGNVPRSLHGTPVHQFANTIRAETGTRRATPREPHHEPGNPSDRAGGDGDAEPPGANGAAVAPAPQRPAASAAGSPTANDGRPAGAGAAGAVPRKAARVEEVTRRADRYAKFFRARGQHDVAGWMDRLKAHVQAVGADAALAALGEEGGAGPGAATQYEGKAHDMGAFCECYLNRCGIVAVADISGVDPQRRLVSSQSPTFGAQARPDPYLDGDFAPRDPTFANKLQEAKHLPGLEASEDINVLLGKPITHLTPEVTAKLDATYGPGQWIVKTYGDEAFAGRGVFFPQRAEQIKQDARNTIWSAGENLARYGFRLGRDPDTGRVFGLVHDTGDTYQFATPEYEETIGGDARHWADLARAAATNEAGAELPFGGKEFMAQPAFPVVGISDADRAAGMTIKPGQEGRVHIVTRNGKAEIIPHSTWLKYNDLPVVFEDADTQAMAKAAQEAIAALPESERQGQIYAPDIVKTANGYRVVEANPANETGSSGYLGDNPFIIDAYVSHLVGGREPAHVKFIRELLSERRTAPAS